MLIVGWSHTEADSSVPRMLGGSAPASAGQPVLKRPASPQNSSRHSCRTTSASGGSASASAGQPVLKRPASSHNSSRHSCRTASASSTNRACRKPQARRGRADEAGLIAPPQRRNKRGGRSGQQAMVVKRRPAAAEKRPARTVFLKLHHSEPRLNAREFQENEDVVSDDRPWATHQHQGTASPRN